MGKSISITSGGRRFLCVLAALAICVGAFAQNVTLSVKDKPLKDVLTEITAQTGKNFTYTNALQIDRMPEVTYKCDNAGLTEVLDAIFAGRIAYRVYGNNIALAPAENAKTSQRGRTETVRGTITDSSTGEPVVGAVVMVKGTNVYSFTDAAGRYSISASSDDILTVSLLGMQGAESSVGERKVMNFALTPDTINLESTVCTGYQTISKERATGAFDNVGKVLLDKPQVSVESSLVGNVSGLQVIDRGYNGDRQEQIIIRGITSLGANASPLVVVDGFAIEGSLSSLNPNDIANISVLKDAAAASIWGARSANGVIVVTTKGASKGKVTVELNAFVKASDYFDLDYANPKATSAETIEYEKLGYSTRFFNRGNYLADNYSSRIYYQYGRNYSQASVLMNENRLGYLSDSEMNSELSRLSTLDNRGQIRKYLMSRPLTQQYNLNITGGTDRINNVLSLMYENNIGSFKGNKNSKYTINYRSKVSVYKWLDFTFSSMFNYSDVESGGTTLSDIRELSPYDMLIGDDGSYLNIQHQFYSPIIKRKITDAGVSFPYSDWGYNPVQEVDNRSMSTKSIYARFQAGLTFKIVDGLTFDSKAQYEIQNSRYKALYGEDTYQVRFVVNSVSKWDGNPSTPVSQNWASGMGIQESSSNLNAYNFRNQLNYNVTLGGRHEISAIAGTEVSNRVYQGSTGSLMYGYDDTLLSITAPLNGVYSSNNPIYNMFGSREYYNPPEYPTNRMSYTTDRYFSMYANASYTYDRKYTLSGSVRSDASNLISSDPSIRYSPFWSLGATWNLTGEDFMKEYTWIDRLALRATYGFNGNVDNSSSVDPLISIWGTDPSTGTGYGVISEYGNPYLSWEKTGTFDVGVDYSLFGGKLFGKLDYYDKEGRDLISMESIANVYGTDSQSMNAISMYNKGVELTVGSALKNGDFSWTGNMSFSYNKNKITKLYKDAATLANRVYGPGSGWEYAEGYDASTLWVFKYGGMQLANGTNQPVIVDKNGENPRAMSTYHSQFDSSDYLVSAGPAVAPCVIGLNNSFSYKNLTLSFIITGYFGHKFIRKGFNYPSMSRGNGDINKYYSEIVNCDPNEYIPLLDFAGGEFYPIFMSTYVGMLDNLVCDASNIRFQEINLNYTFSKRAVEKMGISGLSVYGQVNNAGEIFFNKYGQDPLYPMGTVKPGPSYTMGFKFNF